MAVSYYIQKMEVTCTTLAEFNKILTDAQNSADVTNIVSDSTAKTLSFTLTVSG